MFKNQHLNVAPAAVMTAGSNVSAFAQKRVTGGVLQTLFTLLLTWEDRINQRQTLRDLDDRALADMGISHADVDYEAGKPFWVA